MANSTTPKTKKGALSSPQLLFGSNNAPFGVAVQARPPFTNRPSSGDLNGPTTSGKAVIHNANRYPVFFGNFCPRPPVWGHVDNGSISRLRGPVSPNAIFGRVPLAVVQPLDSEVVTVTRLDSPFVERFKSSPVIANGYALAPIVLVCTSASGKHVAPAGMDTGSFHSVSSRPRTNRRSRALTATRDTFAASDVTTDDVLSCPARARAQPNRTTTFGVARLGDDKPMAELPSSHINFSRVLCHAKL